MKKLIAAMLLLIASNAPSQVVSSTARGIVVAHDGRVDLFDPTGQQRLWSQPGVDQPSRIVSSGARIAVIDTFANRVALIRDGRGEVIGTGETPLDGIFAGEDLILLERDARVLERIAPDGTRSTIALAADPAFLIEANGMLYVYSRLEGIVQEVWPERFAITRRAEIAPFASDFETDGKNGYLLFPAEAKLRSFPLSTLKLTAETRAGAVPVDMALLGPSNVVKTNTFAIADAAARRVWTLEGLQSVAGAFARGFVRGLLGLGLLAPGHSEFPTGVDRVAARGSTAVAYDSASGTLYRFRGSKSTPIAKNVASGAFAPLDGAIAVWQDGALRLIRLNGTPVAH